MQWLNPVAESMTGWSKSDAKLKPLSDVFNIVHAESRLANLNPVTVCLQEGRTVGLQNHTALISRTGAEYGIEDSTSPITDLAARFGVGRNAVREAMQRLAERGIVDLSRHKSATIRQFHIGEALEVLDVAEVMTGLATRAAALEFNATEHAQLITAAMHGFPKIGSLPEPGVFSKARRRSYRALLIIGANRELQRLFPAISMHIIYSQYHSPRMQDLRIEDYRAIHDAVISGDIAAAERSGRNHVERVRAVILSLIEGDGLRDNTIDQKS